jgi:hypothetical protein
MIVYTNDGNILGLQLVIGAKLAGKSVTVKTVNLEGNDFSLKQKKLPP